RSSATGKLPMYRGRSSACPRPAPFDGPRLRGNVKNDRARGDAVDSRFPVRAALPREGRGGSVGAVLALAERPLLAVTLANPIADGRPIVGTNRALAGEERPQRLVGMLLGQVRERPAQDLVDVRGELELERLDHVARDLGEVLLV